MSPSPHDAHPTSNVPPGRGSGTRLETVEEIRQALSARRPATMKEAVPDTQTFRPFARPPMALLCILDDGCDTGEWMRVRGDTFIIGRSEGDVIIPHDTMMSGRHAELSRRQEQGQYSWYLTDLQSTNGTYVRIGTALIRHNQELLIGSHRYRFHAAPQGATVDDAAAATVDHAKSTGTRGWQSISPVDLFPALVELTPRGEGPRFRLTGADNWIGRDKAHCTVALDDPLVSPRHAHLYRDAKDRWHIENAKSLNGTWLRIDQTLMDTACHFQLGEQRFLLRVL
jgi:pSer/pThr/pTyr-binding forkhead associated (FHA) protein